eukprot:2766343-Alexandrium_andersonii.AAC.1
MSSAWNTGMLAWRRTSGRSRRRRTVTFLEARAGGETAAASTTTFSAGSAGCAGMSRTGPSSGIST